MNTFVAFQLGINLGKRQVKMNLLKETLEKAGYTNVRTLLASGNVVLEAANSNQESVQQDLDSLLTKTFGFEIKNIVRPLEEIKQLVASDPFKKIKLTPQTRLNVTFLKEEKKPPFTIPYTSEGKDFQILSMRDGMVCSRLILKDGRGTVDIMAFLVKAFGKEITTRNWNTILKIAMLDM